MARIVYEDAWVTEFDDGTEEVRFSDAEWAHMMANAAQFGYACGIEAHGARQWNRELQLCLLCEVGEDDYSWCEEEGR